MVIESIMKLHRRQFTSLAAWLLALPGSVHARSSVGKIPLFLSAASDRGDNHWVIGFRHNGIKAEEVFRHRLPARAHHIAVHEGLGIYTVIARRPGRYLWTGDLESGEKLAEISVPHDRHLYGHGVFSADGSTFYTAESAYQLINGDSGRVVVWQVTRNDHAVTMVRSTEYPSYGVGPHELLLKNDQTLVVANGGIRTHPDSGREKLNIESMQPSLVYMAADTGALIEQQFLDTDYHKASIRHLDINADGLVAAGLQYEGEPFERAPLIMIHEQGSPIQTFWAPEPSQSEMKQYVGSVRFDLGGSYFAASCPRGNLITFWDARSGEMVNALRSRDGCGVCAVEDGFVFTAGTGRISHYNPTVDDIVSLDVSATGKVFWDNHLTVWQET